MTDEDGLARGSDCSHESGQLGLRLIEGDDLHSVLLLLA
jgi:hypothetical protein